MKFNRVPRWASAAGIGLCMGLNLSMAAQAEPVKVLRYILPAAETSLDPATGRDLYTGHITEAIFERLYTYDYLARPVKLAPQTAAALPEVSADGKTYLIHLAHGQYFTPDPAFKGKRRELSQLAALALEGRVRREILAVRQMDQIGLAVGRHLRQGGGRLRRQLDGAGQVIVGVEPLEDGFGDVAGVEVAAGGRVEAGFGGRQDVAQHFERRLGRDGRDRQGQACLDQSCAALPQKTPT